MSPIGKQEQVLGSMTAKRAAAGKRREDVRDRIVLAARELVAERGFSGAQMSLIAIRARVAVGTIYKHFPSRAALFGEVYRSVAAQEFGIVEESIASAEGSRSKIAAAVGTFCARALRARRFAYSLLAEPIEPLVDEHRLVFREGYRRMFADLLAKGIAVNDVPAQDVDVSAAAILGIMTETLVRPLSESDERTESPDLVEPVVALCLRAIGLGPAVGGEAV